MILDQSPQVRAEAGREDDRVECFALAVGEYDTVGSHAIDAATNRNRAVPDLRQRADVDQRHVAVLLHHPPRSLGSAAQSELLEIADRKPQHRRVDGIDQPRRQMPVQDHPGQDRNPQEIARDHLDRTAHGERDIDVSFGEIERDLAARIAEADHEHALADERRGIAIVVAVKDASAKRVHTRPGRPIRRMRQFRSRQ